MYTPSSPNFTCEIYTGYVLVVVIILSLSSFFLAFFLFIPTLHKKKGTL